MKKIYAAALIAATLAAPAFAGVEYRLDRPDSTHWQLWARDTSDSDNLGIKFIGATIWADAGTVGTSAIGAGAFNTAARVHDSANGVDFGFTTFSSSTTSVSGGTDNGKVVILDQGSGGSVLVDAAIFGVGQGADATPALGYHTRGGLVGNSLVGLQSLNDIGGWVEFATGTNTVGSANLFVQNPSATLFSLTQPVDGSFQLNAASFLVTPTAAVPEPSGVLALGWLAGLGLMRVRRRAAKQIV